MFLYTKEKCVLFWVNLHPQSSFLLHCKAASLLDSLAQLVVQQLIAVVCWDVDSVKARVSFWQVLNGNVGSEVDGEESRRGCTGVAL